ncbi:purine-binding chemotaxis protein CheW [Candidatus Pacearchaeota archaeon]|nr:purine-binding chemotaxis protein CheW [Candidatus Pacearchaeota archaeon]
MNTERQILIDRAKELAGKKNTTSENGNLIQIIEFRLNKELYGLEIDFVHEVHSLRDITPIPGTPSYVRGVINIRGQIVSVIDLKVFFELDYNEISDKSKVIILQSEDMEFAILADEVIGTKLITLTDTLDYLPTLSGVRADFLKGVTNDGIAVLDGRKILTNPNLIIDEKVD